MSTKDFLEKDYYKSSVSPRTPPPDEIKKAYRKLARQVPPGRQQGRRRGRGAVQGDLRGLRRPVRRPSAARSTTRRARCSAAAVPRPAPARPAAASTFDLGDLFGGGTGQAARRPASGLGDVFGGLFNRRRRRPYPDAPGRAAAQDVESEVTLSLHRGGRRRHRAAAADQRGRLPDLPRHRRQGRHAAARLPDLRGHRPGQPQPGRLRASPSRAATASGRGLIVDDPCADLPRQRPGA